MPKPPIPANENYRLAALNAYGVLDSDYDERFDRLTRLASALTQSPIALVTLVDQDRQWFKSKLGFEDRETSRDVSFCAHAVAQDDILVVEDATKDSRFADNPLVTDPDGPNLRFYAGIPLRSSSGFAIGTLCIADSIPRKLPNESRKMLQDIAAMVCDELELCRALRDLDRRQVKLRALHSELEASNERLKTAAATDALTGLANRRAFDTMLAGEWRRAQRGDNTLSLLLLDVDHFKLYNDHYGHPAGDKCLQVVAAAIAKSLHRPADFAARYGGEEFAVILPETDSVAASAVAEQIRAAIEALKLPHEKSGHGHVTASIGVATVMPKRFPEQSALLLDADYALYRAKAERRNRVSATEITAPPVAAEGEAVVA